MYACIKLVFFCTTQNSIEKLVSKTSKPNKECFFSTSDKNLLQLK